MKKKALILAFSFIALCFTAASVHAACDGCPSSQTTAAANKIRQFHADQEGKIKEYIAQEFNKQNSWFTNVFFKGQILPALQRFADQMAAVAMQQMAMIGTMIDAKHQMESQRLFQELQVQAHKDYQPSMEFCWFGTNVRSLAASEENSRFNTQALSSRQMARHLGTAHTSGAENPDRDIYNRWVQFTTTYCDAQDNNYRIGAPNEAETGLTSICAAPAVTNRSNVDIDYTRLIEEPRTLNVTFTNPNASIQTETGIPGGEVSADEEDVIALGNNLYGHETFSRRLGEAYLKLEDNQYLYMALRSVAAKRSVAEHSYNAIVGMKSAGSSGLNDAGSDTREYLAAIMTEMGVPDDEVFQLIGENPSYYAQLEILAKRIYQSPNFFAGLYDKPANVQRKAAALKAIENMLDRAIYESQLRQEMVMSVLLAARMQPEFEAVNAQLSAGQ